MLDSQVFTLLFLCFVTFLLTLRLGAELYER